MMWPATRAWLTAMSTGEPLLMYSTSLRIATSSYTQLPSNLSFGNRRWSHHLKFSWALSLVLGRPFPELISVLIATMSSDAAFGDDGGDVRSRYIAIIFSTVARQVVSVGCAR